MVFIVTTDKNFSNFKSLKAQQKKAYAEKLSKFNNLHNNPKRHLTHLALSK